MRVDAAWLAAVIWALERTLARVTSRQRAS